VKYIPFSSISDSILITITQFIVVCFILFILFEYILIILFEYRIAVIFILYLLFRLIFPFFIFCLCKFQSLKSSVLEKKRSLKEKLLGGDLKEGVFSREFQKKFLPILYFKKKFLHLLSFILMNAHITLTLLLCLEIMEDPEKSILLVYMNLISLSFILHYHCEHVPYFSLIFSFFKSLKADISKKKKSLKEKLFGNDLREGVFSNKFQENFFLLLFYLCCVILFVCIVFIYLIVLEAMSGLGDDYSIIYYFFTFYAYVYYRMRN